MAVIEGAEAIGLGRLGLGEVKRAIAQYDFARDGGVVGAITMAGDSIPSGAFIVDSLLIIDTIPTSLGSATISVGTEGAADIAAAAAISGAPWSTATAKRGTLTATSAVVKTTAKRSIAATVAVADLTAGKFRAIVSYIEAP